MIAQLNISDINLFGMEKEKKVFKGRISRGIMKLFDWEGDCYKPLRVGNFWNNNYIEYESKEDRNKTISIEYLNKMRSYLKDIIDYLNKSDTRKIQFMIMITFMSSKDNDEECVMHSNIDFKEMMINDKAEEVMGKRFQILLFKYQVGLNISMNISDFVFDCILLLYYRTS